VEPGEKERTEVSGPKISTLVTFRQRRCELVDAFVTAYRREVATALELLLGDEDGDAESLPRGTLEVFLERMLRRMRTALRDLLAAEKRREPVDPVPSS
jgi:hypothetical protein